MSISAAETMNPTQVKEIIDTVVPLIAAEADHEFFKGVLHVRAEACADMAEFGGVIETLLAA